MIGVATLTAVGIGNVILWLLARSAGQPTGRFVGELCGVEAVLLLVGSLVLAALLSPIERDFGELDHVALWHRRVAAGIATITAVTVGTVALAVVVLNVTGVGG
jgi:hypothetical protein